MYQQGGTALYLVVQLLIVAKRAACGVCLWTAVSCRICSTTVISCTIPLDSILHLCPTKEGDIQLLTPARYRVHSLSNARWFVQACPTNTCEQPRQGTPPTNTCKEPRQGTPDTLRGHSVLHETPAVIVEALRVRVRGTLIIRHSPAVYYKRRFTRDKRH